MKNISFISFSNNFKRKMFKYDFQTGRIISKELLLQDFFKNKKVLMIFPFPAKERINSELYDDILKKIKIAKEIETNTDKQLDLKTQDKYEKFEIFKTKYLNELDDIVGLSQLNEKSTEEYVSNIRVPDIWFIVDESNLINDINKFENRYEILLDNMKIISYKPDPTLPQNFFIGSTVVYLIIVFGLFNLTLYYYILRTKIDSDKVYDKVFDAIY